MPLSARRTEKVDLRISPAAKAKLQAAASCLNRSMSEFVLESALSKADDALADRRVFGLDQEQWTAFHSALDAPPRPLPRLQALLDSPAFFDSISSK